MIKLLLSILLFVTSTLAENAADLLLVIGAPGAKEFEEDFEQSAQKWKEAATQAHRTVLEISPQGTNQLAAFTNAFQGLPRDSQNELWIVFLGHGTFDGKEARFNLAGPDLSADQLSKLLDPFTRPLILVNSTSSSSPFLTQLSRTNRILITATKSGWEENYTRFGKYFAQSLIDSSSDLDKDGQVSVLEGFLAASHQVNEFYKNEKRLATEHALLDDNGDRKGTPPTFFKGVRPAKKADDGTSVDGFRAHQVHLIRSSEEEKLSAEARRKRDDLEVELEKLRSRKPTMQEGEYLVELERILLQIAEIYAGETNSVPQSK